MAGTAGAQHKSEEQEELSTLYLSCHHCSPLFFFFSVHMTEDTTTRTFWQERGKVTVKDMAMVFLRYHLMLLLCELDKGLSRLKTVKPQARLLIRYAKFLDRNNCNKGALKWMDLRKTSQWSPSSHETE